MYGSFCFKFSQNRMKGERPRLSPLRLVYLSDCHETFQEGALGCVEVYSVF